MQTTEMSPTPALDFIGSRARILATGAEAPVGVVEMSDVPPGSMPPLHVHRAHDEGFYLLEGELTIHFPGEDVTLAPGEFALGPRGVPHTYRVGSEPAKWLVLSVPAGFERFVAEVAAAGSDPALLPEIAARNEIEILGPPGAMP
jgi:quercetin dioxygenase-like cupin family protein